MRPETCADPACRTPCDGYCTRITAYCSVCRRCVAIKTLTDSGPVALDKNVRRVRAFGECGHRLGASDRINGSCLAMTEANIGLCKLARTA